MCGIGKVFQVVAFGILHAQAAHAIEQISTNLETVNGGFEKITGVGVEIYEQRGVETEIALEGEKLGMILLR